VDFLIVGNGMFGAATARYLAPHAAITVVGPAAAGGTSGVYGAHHDEGRMVGDLSRDIVWAELNRLSREGMTDLDPALITPCGALTVTTPGGPPYLRVAAEIRDRYGADVRVLDVSEVNAAFPMARLDLDETILYQPTAGHFSPRRYVAREHWSYVLGTNNLRVRRRSSSSAAKLRRIVASSSRPASRTSPAVTSRRALSDAWAGWASPMSNGPPIMPDDAVTWVGITVMRRPWALACMR
jgi:hypothetical protein